MDRPSITHVMSLHRIRLYLTNCDLPFVWLPPSQSCFQWPWWRRRRSSIPFTPASLLFITSRPFSAETVNCDADADATRRGLRRHDGGSDAAAPRYERPLLCHVALPLINYLRPRPRHPTHDRPTDRPPKGRKARAKSQQPSKGTIPTREERRRRRNWS